MGETGLGQSIIDIMQWAVIIVIMVKVGLIKNIFKD